jgi:hypothetical protein
MKQTLLIFTFLTLFTYLLFSFVRWQFNPHNWGIEIRGSFVFMVTLCLCISPIIYNLKKIND